MSTAAGHVEAPPPAMPAHPDTVVLALLARRPRPVDQLADDPVWTGPAGWANPPAPEDIDAALDVLGQAGMVAYRDGVAHPTAHAAPWAQQASARLGALQPA